MTNEERKVIELALEALETPWNAPYVDGCDLALGKRVKAITAIKEALAKLEQEPVAWIYESVCGNDFSTCIDPPSYAKNIRPLYTTLPQRKPLTDKQLNIIGSRWHFNLLGAEEKAELFAFARAIEAAHGIKGEA